MAVNRDGVGGVAPGSFYVQSERETVMRFSPGEEGIEPTLEEEWGYGIADGDEQAYVRCGPAYVGVANPAEHTHEKCSHHINPHSGELPGQFEQHTNIAVDQATGDVYVRNGTNSDGTGVREHHLIEVFTANGEIVGEGFGDSADGVSSPPQSIAQSPGALHRTFEAGIAVDESGTVYLLDQDFVGVEHPAARIMSFEPCVAGDYESYCYSASRDIALPESAGTWWKIALIGNNRLVVASESLIQEYKVTAPSEGPVCEQPVTGQLTGLTTNELTGEVFWYRSSERNVRRLAPCDETAPGLPKPWQQIQIIEPQPRFGNEGGNTSVALAVNPTKIWGSLRPEGTFYVIEHSLRGLGDVFVPQLTGTPPAIDGESVMDTTATSTTLTASIDPGGFDVTYHFEYLTDAAYKANGDSFEGPDAPQRAPIDAGHLPRGATKTVAAVISGLNPDTTYRFRVVATSECKGAGHSCEASGAATSFTTFPVGAGLPDGRAYELVSPAKKGDGEVIPAEPQIGSCLGECKPLATGSTFLFPMQSAPDGNAVAYMGYPFSTDEDAAVYNSYVSSRGVNGWLTEPRSPSLLETGSKHLAYSSDLSEGIIGQNLPTLSALAPPGYGNLYVENAAGSGSLVPVVSSTPPHRETGTWAIEYGGHSPDFAGQFFAANDALTQATAFAPQPPLLNATERDLYEWRDGSLSLVNVLPGNGGVAPGASFASSTPDAHGVSANGGRVFWTAGGRVYVREDNQVTRELTHSGTFFAASADGRMVLFSDGCLYSLLSEGCADLTQGKGGFLGMAGQNSDLSRIYFVDTAKLPGMEPGGGEAQAGEPNLYLYEAGSGTRFIVTLGSSDGPIHAEGENVLNDWGAIPVNRTAEASPDGRYLAFASESELTGYGNIGPCGESATGSERTTRPCQEVFLYDSALGSLNCVSCSPTGEAPAGNSTLRRIHFSLRSFPQPRYLTNQGRLFFDSQDRLSAADVNGRVEDVYEREPDGVGSCEEANGCVSLITPGTGAVDSNFLTMGGVGPEEGDDVFFTTREHLVPADSDESIDLYDARVGGGFSADAEIPPTECSGEACQATSAAPTTLTPSSQLFEGTGNGRSRARRCPKGKVRNRKAKCIKRKKIAEKGKRRAARKSGGAR
jgi:hypothetical protein